MGLEYRTNCKYATGQLLYLTKIPRTEQKQPAKQLQIIRVFSLIWTKSFWTNAAE